MHWQYTPFALPLFIGAALLLVAAALAWSRRASAGGREVAGLSLLILPYVLGYAFELGSETLEQVQFWLGVEYVGIVFAPVLLLVTALLLSGMRRRLTRAGLLLLLVIPTITLVLAWTNQHHELIWRGLHIDALSPFTRTHFESGPWRWVSVIYLQIVYVLSAVIVIPTLLEASGLLRRQMRLNLIALSLPLPTYFVSRTFMSGTGFDLVPYSLIISALLMVWALLRYRFVDVLPVAHKAVLDNIPVGVITLDTHERVVGLNTCAIELLGIENAGNLIGQPASQVFAQWDGLWAELCASQDSLVQVESAGSEEPRHLHLTTVSLQGVRQEGIGQLVTIRNVTRQVNLMGALQKSEVRARTYIELANDAIFTLSPDGKLESVNQEVVNITGYPAEELIGQSPLKLVAPDQLAEIADTLAIMFTGDAPAQMDVEIMTRDGERRVLDIRGRLLDESGDEPRTFHIARDVTERRRAEDELRLYRQQLETLVAQRTREFQQEKERAEAVLQGTADTMIILDGQGLVQLINPAFEELTGYPRDQFIGEHGYAVAVELEIDPDIAAGINTALEAHRHWRGDVSLRHASGRRLDVDVSVSPIAPVNGYVHGWVIAMRDVTPFREVERVKDVLLATAAHELRTPLTTIMGFSEILASRQLDPERQRHYLQLINDQSGVLKTIIDDLLDVAKYEAGAGLESEMETLDIIPLIGETLDDVRQSYPERQFDFNPAVETALVRGIPLRLSQVIRNLLVNAVKYSEADTAVTLNCVVETGLARISVKDEGIGLTDEQRRHIFEKFYRVDASNSAPGGTGLGLTIAKLIVEQHGGSIEVDSEVGEGSVFTFTVPLAPTHELAYSD